jgi:hypothetical protein
MLPTGLYSAPELSQIAALYTPFLMTHLPYLQAMARVRTKYWAIWLPAAIIRLKEDQEGFGEFPGNSQRVRIALLSPPQRWVGDIPHR